MQKKTPRPFLRSFIALACIMLLFAIWVEKSLLHAPVSGPAEIEGQAGEETIQLPTQTAVLPEALIAPLQLDRPRDRSASSSVPNWAQVRQSTVLRSSTDLSPLTDEPLPESAHLKVIGADGSRLMVRFGGDGHKLRPDVGWVDSADVAPSSAPRWVTVMSRIGMKSRMELGSPVSSWVPSHSVLEVVEDRGRAARVYSLGDGLVSEPAEGWVGANDLAPAGSLLPGRGLRILSRADVESIRGGYGLWLQVPYRTQLDGSPSASANCGPASVAMAMGHYRIHLPTEDLRSAADRLQGTSDPEGGFAIEFLADLLPAFGLRAEDLYAGNEFKRWTEDDLRRQLTAGHPVIPQLKFRSMPGRSDSDYWEDHYVVLTGILGDDVIYNDAVDVDGPGYGRLMSFDTLMNAWGGSYFPFAAFAVSMP
ncbi:MAG TPA: C39 family peptidase [Chloroflexota bacterium]|nr:C39 family peptidase [Chloroflexota bacterium]